MCAWVQFSEVSGNRCSYTSFFFKDVGGSLQGKRTLDFVLKNRGMIDKTLLFDIELIKILS